MKNSVIFLCMVIACCVVRLHADIFGVFIINKNSGEIVCLKVADTIEHAQEALLGDKYTENIVNQYRLQFTHQGNIRIDGIYSMLYVTSNYTGKIGYWVVRCAVVNNKIITMFGAGHDSVRAIEEADSRIGGFYGVARNELKISTYTTGQFEWLE